MDDKLTHFNATAYMTIRHNALVLNSLTELHKLSCPSAYLKSVDYFQMKRDTSMHANVAQYWHNRIKHTYLKACRLLNLINPDDEQYFGISKHDILTILHQVKSQYQIFNYTLK